MLNMLDIGITLRKYRYKNSYTQQYVANIIGISRVAYRKWENNNVAFSINQLQKVSDLYNIEIDVIIKQSYIKEDNRIGLRNKRASIQIIEAP